MRPLNYSLMLVIILTSQLGFSSAAFAHSAHKKSPAAAQAGQSEGTKDESESASNSAGISTFDLDNGLKVVVIPDHRAPVVTHMVWYKAGSAEDPVGKSGIAHFLEHLMFKGTNKVPVGEFSTKVAEIGGQENAFTSIDYTAYFQKVSPAALKMVMGYEADRMENLVLNDEVIRPERDVILAERRSAVDASPGAILSETLEATLYQHHPYGNPIIGFEDEIRGLTGADAIAFYDKHYTPNNAVLVIAGDVEEEIVRELAEQTYGLVKRRAEPGIRKRVNEPIPVAARTVTYENARVTSPSMSRNYLVPSYTNAKPGEAEALDALATILGGSSASKFHRALVIDSEIATSIGMGYRGSTLDMTRLSIHGSPRGGTTINELEMAIDQIIKEVIENGVTQAELDHAINAMIKSDVYARDSQRTMANIIGTVMTMGGDLDDVLGWTQRLKKVTVDEVNAAAQKYLIKSRSVTGYLLPKTDKNTREKS